MAKKKSKLWLWITLTLVLLLVVAGVALYIKSKQPKPTEVTIEKVELRTLTSIVTATGKIYPETEVKISSEAAGEIIELPVKEGQSVKKGELMARIKPDTYEAQVRQREAAVSSSRALSLQAKAEMLQTQLDLKRIEELFNKGFVPQAELDTSRTQLEIRRAAYESSLYQIKQQETQLDEAREALQKTTIFAPMDGIISSLSMELGERVVGTGQFEGTEIMRVADLSNMELQIDVSENDIVNVKLQDRTKIEIDAIPGKPFIGFVKEIASSSKNANSSKNSTSAASSSAEEITTFLVRIRIDELDPRIRPGMTATADIETATVENVLAVPLQSVTVRERSELKKPGEADTAKKVEEEKKEGPPEEGQKQKPVNPRKAKENLVRVLFVKKDDKVKLRAVTTGISDNSYIEIKEGLKSGEEVVSGTYTAISRELKDESLVKLKEKGKGDAKKPGGK
ncbi:MAG: efflux RND transporter periplasmic adaptor subunit [Verrucomicrobiota bacterium]|nr:efflux RND transporter periplasmic adaptor subunit [Verrucomicrobiota bacterium]